MKITTNFKTCNACGEIKPIKMFNKHPNTADRRQNQCRTCRNKIQRIYRSKKGGESQRRYEKTEKGFLVRVYRNMLSRVRGIQRKGNYFGLEIIEREQFYSWALADKPFQTLFSDWALCGFKRTATPSIDRIDSKKGYIVGNIRWVTHSENSRMGSISRWKGRVL